MKIRGVRNASKATQNIPDGWYVQISLDCTDGEILHEMLTGTVDTAWKRYTHFAVIPVVNTNRFMKEGEINEEVIKALEKHRTWLDEMKLQLE